MIYNRGSPEDYDNWEKNYGAKGWSFDEVLPFFRKAENNTDESLLSKYPLYHARNGPITVTSLINPSIPIIASYRGMIEKLGIPGGDINGPVTLSATIPQRTIKNGIRVSAFTGYLEPNLNRTNLHVWTNSFAEKILFDDNKRAIAVRVKRNGTDFTIDVRARKEIIVSAGVINSPQLLMLSGDY